jgi:hypothetical protein
MKPLNTLMNWGARLILERPVRKLALPDLAAQLEETGKQIAGHVGQCIDSPANRHKLCHIIGIERWGQRRLRVALGEPFLPEEYKHYRPDEQRPWTELKAEWETTRRATLTIVNDLIQAKLPFTIKIPHNQLGPLSLNAWLRYLDVHASMESKRIK